MSGALVLPPRSALLNMLTDRVPLMVRESGPGTVRRYLEFFAASIRNPSTRAAYLIAAEKFFAWCAQHDIGPLQSLQQLHLATYIEQLTQLQSAPPSSRTSRHCACSLDISGFLPRTPPRVFEVPGKWSAPAVHRCLPQSKPGCCWSPSRQTRRPGCGIGR